MSNYISSLLFACALIAARSDMLLAAARDMNQSFVDKIDPDYRWASPQAYEAWKDRRFGMRVHWGIYSTLGVDASWPLLGEDAAWKKLYLTQYEIFNPTEFDANRWAEDAERWGFRYFVITHVEPSHQ
jgi:hypothetical protein